MSDCLSCLSNTGERRISPGGTIHEGQFWLVEHAYPCAIKGWLVIVLKRHAEALHELTAEEFLELGVLQGQCARALYEHLGCHKEYAVCFAEIPGFTHIHFHMVAKPADLAAQYTGSKIFALLKITPEQAVPPQEIRSFCEEMQDRIGRSELRLAENTNAAGSVLFT